MQIMMMMMMMMITTTTIIIIIIINNEHWYDHVPQSVTSHAGKVTILRIQKVQTNRTISNNKPGIIIHDHKKGTYMYIDVAIAETEM